MKTKNEPPLLHKQYPDVFRPEFPSRERDDDGNVVMKPEEPHWTLLPGDFVTFLSLHCTGKGLAVVLALRDAASHDDWSFVKITDRKLAERAGMDRKTLWRIRRSVDFQRLVEVEPGQPRAKNSPGVATWYSLKPLYAQYREWRRLRELGDGYYEETPVVDEVRVRAKAMRRLSEVQVLDAARWSSQLTGPQIEGALSDAHEDPPQAARLLLERHADAKAVAALDKYLGCAA
jgi:hypothetical protein